MLKQVVYGLFYLFVFILIVAPLYFFVFKPKPTCFDGKQNQKEEGVDCGGPCARFCLPSNLQMIGLADKVNFFRLNKNHLTILARLKNPNSTHGASFKYRLTLYDKLEQALDSYGGETFIYPRQIRYLLLPNVSSSAALTVERIGISFSEISWRRLEEFREPRLVLRDQQVKSDEEMMEIDGNITNDDIVDVSRVEVVAVFYNRWKSSIGASRTVLENVRAGETRRFTVVHPLLKNAEPPATQVFILGERL